jgi:hypothetical protein
MSRILKRCARASAPFLLASSLVFCSPVPSEALAQPGVPGSEEEPGGSSKGRPLDGYLATITLMLLVLFIVGKSARR